MQSQIMKYNGDIQFPLKHIQHKVFGWGGTLAGIFAVRSAEAINFRRVGHRE
jgi:hypothetical protein